jgi:hypothetical protein
MSWVSCVFMILLWLETSELDQVQLIIITLFHVCTIVVDSREIKCSKLLIILQYRGPLSPTMTISEMSLILHLISRMVISLLMLMVLRNISDNCAGHLLVLSRATFHI